jgi:hypothetical protein
MAILRRNALTAEVWPNFFIVGTMKGGTTSLYYYMKDNPDIYLPSNKEPNYFASEDIVENSKIVIRDKKKYLSLFANVKDEHAIGEASTTYLYSAHAPVRIHQVIPEAKIVMILRDPIQRAFSQYLANVRNKNLGLHKLSFTKALQLDYNKKDKRIGTSILYVERGMYYEQVKRYFDLFGRRQVKVLIFEEYIRDTAAQVRDVLEFLGTRFYLPPNVTEAYNSFFIPNNRFSHSILASDKLARLARFLPKSRLKQYLRKSILGNSIPKPEIEPDARAFLQEIFEPDIRKLESLLGRTLLWKL